MKKIISLLLVLVLCASLAASFAEEAHPSEGDIPVLTVEESAAVTENPFAAAYNANYESTLPKTEGEHYKNIDTFLNFKSAPAPYLYQSLQSTFNFFANKFIIGNYIINEKLIDANDLLNRFNLFYAEMGRREMLLEGIDAVLPENLVDAARLSETESNPLDAQDNTTVFNNLQFTLLLLENAEVVNNEQALAILEHMKRK